MSIYENRFLTATCPQGARRIFHDSIDYVHSACPKFKNNSFVGLWVVDSVFWAAFVKWDQKTAQITTTWHNVHTILAEMGAKGDPKLNTTQKKLQSEVRNNDQS